MAGLVIFDLDHTLVKTNLSFHLGLYLYKKGVFGWLRLFSACILYFLHKISFLSLFFLHHSIFILTLKGQCKNTITAFVEQFLIEVLPKKLCPILWARLQKAQEQGDIVYLISSSPDFLVERVAHRLGIAYWIASSYQVDERGNFSFLDNILCGEAKADIARQLMEKLGYSKEDVTAYTDSFLDVPLLQEVGHPIAVRPEKRLLKISRQFYWEVISE